MVRAAAAGGLGVAADVESTCIKTSASLMHVCMLHNVPIARRDALPVTLVMLTISIAPLLLNPCCSSHKHK